MVVEDLPRKMVHYAVLMGVLAKAILHINNLRDIKNDKDAKIITVAMLLGEQDSISMFVGLIAIAYGIALYIVLYEHAACVLAMIAYPAAEKIFHQVKRGDYRRTVEQTAFFQLYFGVAMVIGIQLTSKGLLDYCF